jgi:uncharacterized protein (DUF1330 family)
MVTKMISRKGTTVVIQPPEAHELEGVRKPYRVIYMIDVEANNPMEAAKEVEDILDSMEYRPILQVIDSNANVVTIDLEDQ